MAKKFDPFDKKNQFWIYGIEGGSQVSSISNHVKKRDLIILAIIILIMCLLTIFHQLTKI